MDRFIAAQQIEQMTVSDCLKSNMDRFIGFYISKHNFKNAV